MWPIKGMTFISESSTAVCNVLETSANSAKSMRQERVAKHGFIQRVRRSQTMTKVKSGLSRPKTELRFKSRRPKVTVIVAHVHGAPLADVANHFTPAAHAHAW